MKFGEMTIQRSEIATIERKKLLSDDETKKKSEVDKLKAEVKTLKAENAALKEQVRYLTELCKKAGIKVEEPKSKDVSLTPQEKEGKPAKKLEEPPAPQEAERITVYITEKGKKYHRAGCQYLRKSCIPISLEDAKKRGYTPCSRCTPPK
jgi:predicted nuclease with TOPRIM domain